MKPVAPSWSRAQAEFIEGLRQAGALHADTAASIEPSMRLADADLQPLLESGIVLEAGRNRYYLREMTRQQHLLLAMAARTRRPEGQPAGRRRFLMAMIFWLIVIALPIIIIKVLGG